MAVGFSNTNKPLNPRGQDASPKGYNRAALFSGKALDFDGVNDHITIPNSDSVNITGDALTIAGYINTDGSTAWQGICYKDGGNNKGYQLFVDKTGDPNIAFGVHTGTFYRLYSNEVIKNDKWYFVVATYDGVNQSIYINGVFDNSQAVTGNITDSSTQNLYIGRNNTGSERFNGEIGGFKVFNTALTAAQVADLYNNPEKVVPTGVDNTALKLWLPMMEGAGTTAYDGSGNGNHGTISGATYVNGIGAPVAQSAVMDWNKGSNLVTYSEQFDNAYWGVIAMNSIVANDTTAPDGQNTADKITPNATTNIHYIYSTSNFLTGQNTISVFAKHNGYSIGFRPQGIGSNKSFVNFDLQNGVILSTGGTDYNDSSITSFGNGWYRCSMTMTNAGSYGVNFYAIEDGETIEVPSFTADGTSGFYLWGAQVNAGATLGPYVRTGATAQTSPVLLPQGLTTGRDITGVNLFENVRKQGALNLDGNSWAEVHDNESLDITSAITLEAWVYFDGSTDKGILGRYFSGNTSFLLYAANTPNSVEFFTNTSASVKVNLSSGWHHVLGTYDGANRKLYVDGVLENTDAYTSDISTNNKPIEIGRYFGLSSKAYTDQIAQPRIYNRALTASEVLRNYNSGKNTYTND